MLARRAAPRAAIGAQMEHSQQDDRAKVRKNGG